MQRLNESGKARSGGRGWLLAGGLVLSAAMLLSAHPEAQAPAGQGAAPSGNVANGKKLYLEKGCWTCHSYEAQGGNGPRLAATAMPLRAFMAYMRAPRGGMPPYIAKVISDAEVNDLYTFLQASPKPVSPATIPLLKP